MRATAQLQHRHYTQRSHTPQLDSVLQFMQLMWAVDHELQRVSKRMGRVRGITGPQRLVLLLLGQLPGMSAGQLARTLHLDPSTLTGILRRLEESGLLVRTADSRDGRRVRLALSAAGRAANRQRGGTVESAVRHALIEVPASDFAATRRTLERIAAALRHVAAD